ncbi:hypothetical protein ACI2K4_06410 [Micromonospora sp. NPDC050397]|uniref:hypothetical protein n=1 Tax=Micromonospora sp. NPDC050397 TaxID=3364279 RepID=UPI00384EE302
MPSEADHTTAGPLWAAATPTIAVAAVPLVTPGSIRPPTPTADPGATDQALATLPRVDTIDTAASALADLIGDVPPALSATATTGTGTGTGTGITTGTAPPEVSTMTVPPDLATATHPPGVPAAAGYVPPVRQATPTARPPLVPWAAPTADHPICSRRAGPRGTSRQILGVCGWATVLGLVGLGTGLRGLVAIVAGVAPNWYEPTMASIGLGGIVLTMVAFLFIRHPRLPWIMLGLATVPLAVNLALTLAAL